MYVTSYGGKVTMVDLSGAGFEVAKRNFASENLEQPRMLKADARDTHLPTASFDCVYSIGLLEHFEDPKPVLAEAVRLLRPGGLHFGVIVSGRSDDDLRTFIYAFLRPLSFLWKLLPVGLRRSLRPKPARDEDQEFRNNIGRAEYLEMLRDMNVVDACCIPYNPYHSVYNSDFLEENVTVSLYRLHHALKGRLAGYPLLQTWPHVASCELLLFRKAA
jgi:2-polyprenyl-3-methyl-5-hydroxy-6-metoxy-1,4-benzoquinol methylase